MIVTRGLTKRYGKTVGRQRPELHRLPRRRYRLPRAQRLGEVHDDAHGRSGSTCPTPDRRTSTAPASPICRGRCARWAPFSMPRRSTRAAAPATTCVALAQTNDIPQAGSTPCSTSSGSLRWPTAAPEVLPRHGSAARHRQRPPRRPGRPALRRTGQRPRPRRHPLGTAPAAGTWPRRVGRSWSRAIRSTRWPLPRSASSSSAAAR